MKYLWMIFALFITCSAIGQANLLSKKGSKYYYKDKNYKCKELSVVYVDHIESLNLYTSGRGNVKAANVLGYVGLGFIALGGGLAAGGQLEGAIVGGLSISIGLLLEIIGIIPRAIGKSKLRKAMKTFNFEMIKRHGYNTEPSLSFGMTRNGMGFVYQF